MAYTPAENFPELLESMKRAAAALRDAGVPYMLGGGLAAWARGGPPTEHDVDFFVRPEHAEQALDALVAAGMTAERPPEAWLVVREQAIKERGRPSCRRGTSAVPRGR